MSPTLKDVDFTSSGEKITIGPEAKEAVLKKLESDVLVSKNAVYVFCTMRVHVPGMYNVHTETACPYM